MGRWAILVCIGLLPSGCSWHKSACASCPPANCCGDPRCRCMKGAGCSGCGCCSTRCTEEIVELAARPQTAPERIAFMPRLLEDKAVAQSVAEPVLDGPPAPAVEVPRAKAKPAALRLEVFDLVGTVSEGQEAEYVVRVTNQGTATAQELQIWASASAELKPVAVADYPDAVILDQAVQLTKIDLPAAESRTYRLRLQGVRAGDGRLKVGLIGKDLESPVIEEESTTVVRNGETPRDP